MALIKRIPTDFGIAAEYWSILSLEMNRVQRAVQVTMAGYADEAARRDGHRPLAVVPLAFDGDHFPGDAGGIGYGAIYARIKAAAQREGTTAAVFVEAVDG